MTILLCIIDTPPKGDIFRGILPIGIPSIAATLMKDGHRVIVANFARTPLPRIERFLLEHRPPLVGISVFTHNRVISRTLAETVRRLLPEATIICGGPHATFSVDEILAWGVVDGIVRGEGEITMGEIARHLAGRPGSPLPPIPGLATGRHPFTPRPPIRDLDTLPFPHRGLAETFNVDVPLQAEFIVTSRGCPSSCTFCSSPSFWGRGVRFRSPDSVIAEMKELRRDLGLITLSIRDDTFTVDRARTLEICRRMREERLFYLWNCQSRVTAVDQDILDEMKRSGCETIQLGVESGSPATLGRLGKGITPRRTREAIAAARRSGMLVSLYLMAGVPGESDGDIAETIRLIRETLPHDGQVSPLALFPGTALFSDAVEKGGVPPDIFAASSGEAVYLLPPRQSKPAVNRILSALGETAHRASYRERDFREQERRLGPCYTTTLLRIASHTARGEIDQARHLAISLCKREPDNPWGWLSLAEQEEMGGNRAAACRALDRLSRLVPENRTVARQRRRLCRSVR
ncbi:MAG: B12-binding domain-containing radical SAM protein [Desulfuromonadia bacterium]